MNEFEPQAELPQPSLVEQAWIAGRLVVCATACLVGSLEALSAESVGDVVFGTGLIVAGAAFATKALEECGIKARTTY